MYSLSWPYAVDRSHSIPGDGSTVTWSFTTDDLVNSRGGGAIMLAEFGSPPTQRKGSLSLTPGDLTGGIGGMGVFANSTDVSIPFLTKAPPPSKHLGPPEIMLQPNTTYYLNVANQTPGAGGGVTVQLSA